MKYPVPLIGTSGFSYSLHQGLYLQESLVTPDFPTGLTKAVVINASDGRKNANTPHQRGCLL